ncbi:MAG: ABC transporter ATP-binding protein [Campylobacterota bacterium]
MSVTAKNLRVNLGKKPIIEATDFTLHPGRIHMLIGPNGAGKSTLLHTLAGLLPYSGGLYYQNRQIRHGEYKQNAKTTAMMQQFYNAPAISGFDLLSLGRRPYSGAMLSKGDTKIIQKTASRLGVSDLLKSDISTLSGGQRQLLYLAKALVQTPRILLLDEPIAHLDPKNQMDILDKVKHVTYANNLITVIVMHDLQSALHYGDEILMMAKGRLCYHVQSGEVEEEMFSRLYELPCTIFKQSGHPFVLLGHSHVHKSGHEHRH